MLRLDRKLGKCNTKYGRYVYCTAAAWSEYFPEKFPRISQHLAENSRGPPSGLIIRLNIYIFHFPAFFRSPAVHYGGKRTLKGRRERYLPSPRTSLPKADILVSLIILNYTYSGESFHLMEKELFMSAVDLHMLGKATFNQT